MLNKIDELKLISQCVLADNRHAFGQLVEAYQPSVRRFFMNLTLGDASLCDDLAQETFIKAYLSIRSFKGMSNFSTWLYRIGYNEFYNEKRRRHEESEEAMNSVPDELTDSVSASEAHIDVATMMKSLNEKERTVITLFYLEDYPLKKIAVIMQIPENTVKSHLTRAKAKMADVVNKDNNSQQQEL
jgi:RNA polymerase sigma-70 factor (ECF subfamily)